MCKSSGFVRTNTHQHFQSIALMLKFPMPIGGELLIRQTEARRLAQVQLLQVLVCFGLVDDTVLVCFVNDTVLQKRTTALLV